jgi:hypothetical protein
MAATAVLSSREALAHALTRLRETTPCDEVILVPGTPDPACADGAAAVVSELG